MQAWTWEDIERRISVDDEEKHDIMADAISLSVESGMIRLPEAVGSIVPGRTIGRFLQVTDRAEAQLCSRLGVPVKYLGEVRGTDPGLADRMLNHGLSQLCIRKQGQSKTAKLLLRMRGSTVRAALSDTYSVVDNKDLIQIVRDLTVGKFDHTIRGFGLNDEGFWLKITCDDLSVDDPSSLGNTLKIGFVIGNSEVGARMLVCDPFLFRQVCLNDALVVTDKAVRQRHAHLDTAAIKLMLTRSIGYAMRTGDEILGRALALRDEEVEKPEDVIKALCQSQKYSKRHGDLVLLAFEKEPEPTRWGVVNAITRAAQQTTDIDLRIGQERFAGSLIEDHGAWAKAA